MERTVRVLLNGKEVHGYPGQKILDLCAECGVEIPTLCYNEHLSIHGGCSLCLVEIEGAKALVRACASTIAPDMVIRTDTKRANDARRLALELLLSDHVGDCRPPCTLACPAQANVQGYINTAAQGKFSEALDILHKNIVLPSSIGTGLPRSLSGEVPQEVRGRGAGLDQEHKEVHRRPSYRSGQPGTRAVHRGKRQDRRHSRRRPRRNERGLLPQAQGIRRHGYRERGGPRRNDEIRHPRPTVSLRKSFRRNAIGWSPTG